MPRSEEEKARMGEIAHSRKKYFSGLAHTVSRTISERSKHLEKNGGASRWFAGSGSPNLDQANQ
jgi:hypothetical protein